MILFDASTHTERNQIATFIKRGMRSKNVDGRDKPGHDGDGGPGAGRAFGSRMPLCLQPVLLAAPTHSSWPGLSRPSTFSIPRLTN